MSKDETQELISISEFRSKSYWFLARCFAQRPELVFLNEIHSSLSSDNQSTKQDLSADLVNYINNKLSSQQNKETFVQNIGKEYTRLFRGIEEGYGPAPPYASVYLEGKLMGDSTVDIIRYYHQAGFDVIDEELSPQDHIGALFKFMSMLAFQEHEAWLQGKTDNAQQLLSAQGVFFKQYIISWIPDYCEKLLLATKEQFYLHIIKITQQVLDQDKLLLSELIDELEYDKP